MSKPRLLDLFCKEGGAGVGYHRAGFEVLGVDIEPQPNYPFEFIQADALEFITRSEWRGLGLFHAIHASPPCQAYSEMATMPNARRNLPKLIAPVRELLEETGLPYVIENVEGARADLREPMVKLCGSMFGLGVEVYDGWRTLLRHRYFEVRPWIGLTPPCVHRGPSIGFYGDHARDRRRSKGIPARDFPEKDKKRLAQVAMDMPWVSNWKGLTEAVPPAYTEWIGRQLMAHLEAAA